MEDRKASEKIIETFFDEIAVLDKFNCPKAVVVLLESKREEAIFRSKEMRTSEKNVPHLLVLPACYRDIYTCMNMIRNGEQKGVADFCYPQEVHDLFSESNNPYIVYDIRVDKVLDNVVLEGIEENLEKENRRGLTLRELIFFLIYNPDLLTKDMDFVATKSIYIETSRTENNLKHFVIALDDDGTPELQWRPVFNSHNLSVVSCRVRNSI